MMQSEKDELLKYIYTASFAMDDVILYLDTHPSDETALEYYRKVKAIRDQAVKEYTTYFGPLTAKDVKVTNKWTWVQDPWPWEMER